MENQFTDNYGYTPRQTRLTRTKSVKSLVPIGFLVIGLAALVFGVQKRNEFLRSQAAEPVKFSQGLEEKVGSAGREGKMVRVIVGLNNVSSFTPEGNLSSDQVNAQRKQISTLQTQILNAIQGTKYEVLYKYPSIPFIALSITPDTFARLKTLNGIVTAVSEDYQVKARIRDSRVMEGVFQYEQFYSGGGATVAVMDSGIDSTHSFLTGKVIGEVCFGTCPNGTNFQEGVGSAPPCDWNYIDCPHGTAVAGAVAGVGGSGGISTDYAGIAKSASILSVRYASKGECYDHDLNPTTANICDVTYWGTDDIGALSWVYDHRGQYLIAAINRSQGGTPHDYYCDADITLTAKAFVINNLRTANIPVVVPTGNEGKTNAIEDPACLSTTIAVGAVDKQGVVTSGSDLAPFAENTLLAVGKDVVLPVPGGMMVALTGTSVAAPQVAGAFAILTSLSPTATVEERFRALKDSALLVADNRPGATGTKYPFIQINKAIEALNSKLTSFKGASNGVSTTWEHNGNAGVASSTLETQVLAADSSYSNAAIVTAAYSSSSTATTVKTVTYCGEAMQRVGTTPSLGGGHKTEIWYKVNPRLGVCPVVVTFTADPGQRVLSSTIFNNVDITNPLAGFTTKGFNGPYTANPGKIEISLNGPKDSTMICTYSHYSEQTNPPGPNYATALSGTRQLWKFQGKIDNANANIWAGLGAGIQRSADSTQILSWSTVKTQPWSATCVNLRTKPLVRTTPPPPTPVPPTPGPVIKPTVNLKVNNVDGPITLNAGVSATLSWTSTNATSCSASGAWSGARAVSGSESTGPLNVPQTYTITCSNSAGSATDSVVVNVSSSTTSINYFVDIKMADAGLSNYKDFGSYNAARGEVYTLQWKTSSDITKCVASGGQSVTPTWSGDKALSGTATVTNSLGYGAVGLICYGKWGVTSDSVIFGMGSGKYVDLKGSRLNGTTDTNVYTDGPVTLRAGSTTALNLKWQTAPGFTSCTASGNWTGTKAASGTQKFTFATAGKYQYILTCKNSSGASSQDHISVNVEAANSLTPPAILNTSFGYQGNYYKNKAFETFKFQKIDDVLRFDWGSASSPNTSVLGIDAFSIRWGAQIVPWKTGAHKFTVTSDEGVRVYLDGKLIIDNWTAHSSTVNTATVNLVAGRPNKLRIDYYEGTGKALLFLSMTYGTETAPALVDVHPIDPL